MSTHRLAAFAFITAVGVLSMQSACSSKSSGGGTGGDSSSTTNDGTADESKDDGVVREPIFGTAKITGRIVLDGEPPPKKKIQMQGAAFCVANGVNAVAPKFQVGEDGGLPFTFVYIKKGIAAKYPPPEEKKTLNQTGCRYEPHIFGIQVGQTLQIKNNDATTHNVHSLPKKNQKFNFAQAIQGMIKDEKFDRQEIMVKLKCDVHGWMEAYAGVLNHPFFAVTDENGNFEIDKLPPGKFTIEAWHELYGTRRVDLTIAEGESKEASVTFKKR